MPTIPINFAQRLEDDLRRFHLNAFTHELNQPLSLNINPCAEINFNEGGEEMTRGYKLHTGMHVRLNPEYNESTARWYEEQVRGYYGTIVSPQERLDELTDLDEFVRVKWANGYTNCYYYGSLIPTGTPIGNEYNAQEDINNVAASWSFERQKSDPVYHERRRKEEDMEYKYPLMPGQKVCVNPESTVHKNLQEANLLGEGEGYVVDVPNLEELVAGWHAKSNRGDIIIFIHLEKGGNNIRIRCKDLFLIENAPAKTVTSYTLDHATFFLVEGTENAKEIQRNLDYDIINKSRTIYKIAYFTEEHRKHIREQIDGVPPY